MQVQILCSAGHRFRAGFICAAICGQFLFAPVAAAQQPNDETGFKERSPVDDIRELGTHHKNSGRSVTIRGTVTYSSSRRHRMFVQDETGGVQIYARDFPDVDVGEQVEVTGRVSVSSDYKCASIRLDRLERLGRADLPPVIQEDAAEFDPLDASGLLVDVRGVVRNYSETSGHHYVKVVNSRREIIVAVSKYGQERFDVELLGAEILVRGVWRAEQSSDGLSHRLYPSLQETVRVLHADPPPPASRAIADLDTLGKAVSVNSRVRLKGRVTAVVGRWIYLADETGAATARLISRQNVDTGRAVEVTGYVARDREVPYLVHASLNNVGDVAPVSPRLITMADSSDHVNELVKLQGVVQELVPSSEDLLIRLRDGTDKILVSAKAVKDQTYVQQGDTLAVSGVIGHSASGPDAHRLFLTSAPTILHRAAGTTDKAGRGTAEAEPGSPAQFQIWAVIGALACGCLVLSVVVSRNRMLKEQRDTQHHLLTRVEELSHASRVNMLGDIVGALSHELNQPLTSVVNYAAATSETVKNLPALPHEDVTSLLQGIEDEAFRAGEIIRRLRDLSKKTVKGRSIVDINELTQQTVTFYKAQFVSPHNLFSLNLSPSLPDVKVDSIQVQQVILNLLSNAREATESIVDRAPLIQISTELDDEGRVQVIVEDNGRGPGCEDLELIFQSFYTTKDQGMGVGLAVCRLIAEVHNGSLQAELVEPIGCRLRLTLPAEKSIDEVD